MTTQTPQSQNKLLAENRKARLNYELLENFECGIVLVGSEVKSLRAGQLNFGSAYAWFKEGELFLEGLEISAYKQGSFFNHAVEHPRKLLLHRKEISRIAKKLSEKGLTLVPLKIYLKNSRVKVLIALAKGRTHHDKRDYIKEREGKRQIARVLKRG